MCMLSNFVKVGIKLLHTELKMTHIGHNRNPE
jgi:hypothetical protein